MSDNSQPARLLKRSRVMDVTNYQARSTNGKGVKRRRVPHSDGADGLVIQKELQTPAGNAGTISTTLATDDPNSKEKSSHSRWSEWYSAGGRYLDLDPVITVDEQ